MPSPFAKTASNKDFDEKFEIPPGGMHVAVLIGLVDLGTHTFVGAENTSENRKIFLAWELTAERQRDGTTFVVGKEYTWSLSKKAHFRVMLEGWSGRSFNDQEEFDPAVLVMKPCVITLKEGTSKKDRQFVDVVAVANPMKGQKVPPATRKPFSWHLSQITCRQDEIDIPDWMPRAFSDTVLEKIQESKEWNSLPALSVEHALDNPVGNGALVSQGVDEPPF